MPGNEMGMVAVSIRPDGFVTVFQKAADGSEYWFRVKVAGLLTKGGFDWNIGQDGVGKYKHHADFEVKNFRFWNRALTLDELRKLEIE